MTDARERTACLWIPETNYGADSVAAPERICVIDLGTNSFHAIIVDAHPNGSYQVVDRLKEMVRLGQHGLNANRLPDDAMDRGVQALRRIKLLAEGWGAREYLAFATSAIREATNGGAFIDRVRKTLGLRIRPISGTQEAELIFEGVRRAVDLPGPSLIVDIGGGSVEFIVAVKGAPVHAVSLKLGAARMTERFIQHDPMSDDEQAALRAHYQETLSAVAEIAREHGVTTIVGSSGTMQALARVTIYRGGDDERSIFQQTLAVDETRDALQWVIQASIAQREARPAIEERRADQIGAGAVLLDTIFDLIPEVTQFRVSSHALREGMVSHYIDQNMQRIQHLAPYKDVRRRSVYELAFRFNWEARHAQHVAATAAALFDACRPLYDGPASDAELLEYAALLHDIGYHISHAEHHKHSRYLIQNADLQGFQPEEVKILALVARYHRKAKPKKKHKRYRALSRSLQRRVRQLAALLRIAEGLDRSHFQNVTALQMTLTPEALRIEVAAKGDPQLEVWAATEEGALFETVFDRTLAIQPGEIGVDVPTEEPVPASVTHSTP